MVKLNIVRRTKSVVTDLLRRNSVHRTISTLVLLFMFLFLLLQLVEKSSLDPVPGFSVIDESLFEVNSFGSNVDLVSLPRLSAGQRGERSW